MHIIIDGYNVLKQAMHASEISLMQRRAFIAMLAKYGLKKGHSITIVFDGGPTTWPMQEKDHGVTVVYSGIKQSADDYIKKLMQQKPYGLIIVTSDNDIKMNAAKHAIVTIDATDFYMLVRDELQAKSEKKQASLIKTSKEENSLVDSLMRQDTQPIHKLDEIDQKNRNSNGQRPSKKERSYLQKIKKL